MAGDIRRNESADPALSSRRSCYELQNGVREKEEVQGRWEKILSPLFPLKTVKLDRI